MYLIITIRKPVADAAEGEQLYNLVKQRLADRPDVALAAHVANHFPTKEATE
ncbi:hypothetical protein ES703_101097 [subsurface metagenome]